MSYTRTGILDLMARHHGGSSVEKILMEYNPSDWREDMSERVEASKVNRNLGGMLERIAAGETFVLTRYGKDVAMLVPITARPDMEPTDHTPSARSINPLMRKIVGGK